MAADKPSSKGQAWLDSHFSYASKKFTRKCDFFFLLLIFVYRFCATGLPSDIIVEVDDMTFHLHKVSKALKFSWFFTRTNLCSV